jgi:hypothetical protein
VDVGLFTIADDVLVTSKVRYVGVDAGNRPRRASGFGALLPIMAGS